LLEIFEKIPSTFETQTPAAFSVASPPPRIADENSAVEQKSSTYSTNFLSLRNSFSASPGDVGVSSATPKRRKVVDEKVTKYFSAKSPIKKFQESPKIELFDREIFRKSREDGASEVCQMTDSNGGPKIEFFDGESFGRQENKLGIDGEEASARCRCRCHKTIFFVT
jgi:hypothetical protein